MSGGFKTETELGTHLCPDTRRQMHDSVTSLCSLNVLSLGLKRRNKKSQKKKKGRKKTGVRLIVNSFMTDTQKPSINPRHLHGFPDCVGELWGVWVGGLGVGGGV